MKRKGHAAGPAGDQNIVKVISHMMQKWLAGSRSHLALDRIPLHAFAQQVAHDRVVPSHSRTKQNL
jgi:hypothetical protein